MKTLIARQIMNPTALQCALHANGFPTAIVASCPTELHPRVLVDQDDNSPDPTAFVTAFVDPPVFYVTSNKPKGAQGVPAAAADGVDKHTLTIRTLDPVLRQPTPWNGTLTFAAQSPCPISSGSILMIDGVGAVQVGPQAVPGLYTFVVKYADDADGWSMQTVQLAFQT